MVQFQEVWVQNWLVTSCHFQAWVISAIKTLLMFMIKLCMLEFDQIYSVKIPFERSISWFHNNKETTKRHVSLKGEMWSRNKMQNDKNSITWLTVQRPSWINYSSNICVSPSNFDHMSFLKMFGDNIANDTLLRKLHSSPAHQLPDSLLEILETIQLKWLKTPPWQHISCLDWTT